MAYMHVHARHNADNTHIIVSRNGRSPYAMVAVADLESGPDAEALSLQAVARWLQHKGKAANPLDMVRAEKMQTPAFPYAVKVRCLVGIEA